MYQRADIERAGSRHRSGVARSDLRWLVAWLGVFLAAIVTMLAAHQVYRLTGPHPQVTVFIRRVKHHARWLIPGLKGRRSSHVPPALAAPPAARHAASGQPAQRSKA